MNLLKVSTILQYQVMDHQACRRERCNSCVHPTPTGHEGLFIEDQWFKRIQVITKAYCSTRVLIRLCSLNWNSKVLFSFVLCCVIPSSWYLQLNETAGRLSRNGFATILHKRIRIKTCLDITGKRFPFALRDLIRNLCENLYILLHNSSHQRWMWKECKGSKMASHVQRASMPQGRLSTCLEAHSLSYRHQSGPSVRFVCTEAFKEVWT